jgi:hypothetical protein
VAFAVAAVSLAAGAHRLAHGDAPSGPVLLVTTLLIAGGVLPFIRHEWRFGGIAVGMTALQGALHLVFGWAHPVGAGGALHHAEMAQPSTGFQHDATMLLTHLAAALVLAWWLRCGEARLWRLARAASRIVLLLFRAEPPVASPPHRLPRPAPGLADRQVRHRRLLALRSSLILRGPPVSAAVGF